MTQQEVLTMVQASTFLTEAERTYWALTLPKMTAEQVQKLEAILERAQKIAWNSQIEKYVALAGAPVAV